VKYGSVVAAPYVGNLMAEILPHLGAKSSIPDKTATVPDLVGKSTPEAVKVLKDAGISYEIIGSGKTVLYQTPRKGEISTLKTKVLLFTEEKDRYVTVPNLCNLSLAEANKILMQEGFQIALSGIENASLSEGATVTAQSIPPGTVVARGTEITLRIVFLDFED
jgi:beta-lactam-binding protein with PASTA domain